MLNLMQIMKKIILLTPIIITLFLVNNALINACECISPAPPKESLEKSTAVFAGKVIDVDVPRGIVISTADPVKVTFEVSKVWKGPDYKTLVVTTARDGASCGYSFKQGEEYIIYTYGEGDKLSTGICSRTKPLANSQQDLEELGEGSLPTNSGSNYVHQASNFVQILSIVGGLIVLIAIVALVFRKYKK